MIKIATVCSGIGAPEVAIKKHPHEIVFACEIDKYARASYLANFTPNTMFEDMTKQEWDKAEQYSDLFIGGIPCQSFSLAGKRLGELDPRGLLFFDFYRYVKNQQPKVFIIENVNGLLSDNKGKTFQNWLLLLGNSVNGNRQMFNHPDSLGYNLHHTVLNSKNFGIPQNRERVFIIGIRKDLPNDFRFPIGWKLDKRLKDILETNVDEKYYLSDKLISLFTNNTIKHKENGNGFAFKPQDGGLLAKTVTTKAGSRIDDNYIEEPICVAMRGRDPQVLVQKRTEFGKQVRKDYEAGKTDLQRKNIQQLEPRNDGVTNTITSVQKDNLILEPQLTQIFQLNGSHEATGRVYSANGLCHTITAKQGGGHEPKTAIGSRIRRLTPLECWRLQGFPDENFYKAKAVNSDTQLYRQAGNSMTTNVMEAIIDNLIHIL